MFFFETVSVYSRDTNAHVNLKYNFGHHYKHYGLREILFWHNEQISLFRALLAKLGKLLVCMLLVIHSITGCGTTSKVVTKGKAFKMACNERQIAKLREHNLGMEMLKYANEFFVECTGRDTAFMEIATINSMQLYVFPN